MSKSVTDVRTIIEIMTLSDHQGQYNSGPTQKKSGIIKLNTNYVILVQNYLLTQIVYALAKQLSKIPQQLKKMHKIPKHKNIAYCELCSGYHPNGFCPPTKEEVNYVNN